MKLKNKYKDEYIDYSYIMRDQLIDVILNSRYKVLDIDIDHLSVIRTGGVYYIIMNALYAACMMDKIYRGAHTYVISNIYDACLKLLKFSDMNLGRFIISRIKLNTDDLLWFCKSIAYLDQCIQDFNIRYETILKGDNCISHDRFISHLKVSLNDDEDGDVTFITLAYMSLDYNTGIIDKEEKDQIHAHIHYNAQSAPIDYTSYPQSEVTQAYQPINSEEFRKLKKDVCISMAKHNNDPLYNKLKKVTSLQRKIYNGLNDEQIIKLMEDE